MVAVKAGFHQSPKIPRVFLKWELLLFIRFTTRFSVARDLAYRRNMLYHSVPLSLS